MALLGVIFPLIFGPYKRNSKVLVYEHNYQTQMQFEICLKYNFLYYFFIFLQDERNQVLTSKVWVKQVSFQTVNKNHRIRVLSPGRN